MEKKLTITSTNGSHAVTWYFGSTFEVFEETETGYALVDAFTCYVDGNKPTQEEALEIMREHLKTL